MVTRAKTLYDSNRFEDALNIFQDLAAQPNPQEREGLVEALRGAAECHKQLKQFEQMLEKAQKVVEIDQNDVKCLVLCGEAAIEIGKQDPNSCELITLGIADLIKAKEICEGLSQSDY